LPPTSIWLAAQRAHFHRGVYGDVRARLDEDVLLDECAKTFDFDGELIRARQHEIEDVLADLVGLPVGRDVRIHVAQRHVSGRNHGAAGIADNSLNPAAQLLSCGREPPERRRQGATAWTVRLSIL
jgi:hypothetical protein